MGGIEHWWAEGERVTLALGGVERAIFVRRMGTGSPMTMLHGFPSSSYDWARVAETVKERHALLLMDFLGFGAVSVTQELLARRAEGALDVDLVAVHLLNGGLYPDVHRPQPIQTALLDPEQGPKIGAAITEDVWVAALQPTFAPAFDATADSLDIWRATSRDDGQLIAHRLIRYITDRATHEQRWVTALETTDVPTAFIWGMLDPVSGAHMAQRITERLPAAPFVALEDVGHWPPLEAPQRVAAALLAS